MATTFNEFDDKICHICAPKTTAAIISCHGCHRHFCRKHFNEHRDQLSKYFTKTVDLHDEIRQDLKTRIDHSSKDHSNDDDARKLLQQIDEWEKRMRTACRHAADKARVSVKQLFDKTEENNSLTERLSSVTRGLDEHQQSENFVENDLDQWMKQLEGLKNDINLPLKFPTDIVIETRDIDWEENIKICQLEHFNKNVEQYVLVLGERGIGKTTFIHYVANLFAKNYSFINRLSQESIEPNQKIIVLYSHDSKQKFMFNRYSFPIDDQTILVFLDPLNYIMNEDEDIVENLFTHLYGINRFTAVVYIIDGTDIEENPDWNDLKNGLLRMSKELRKDRDLFKQLLLVFTNCPPHVLNFNCPTLNIPNKLSYYFMQNSAYQLFRSGSAADSVETDFCKAMETMEKIIKKIGDSIHDQA